MVAGSGIEPLTSGLWVPFALHKPYSSKRFHSWSTTFKVR